MLGYNTVADLHCHDSAESDIYHACESVHILHVLSYMVDGKPNNFLCQERRA